MENLYHSFLFKTFIVLIFNVTVINAQVPTTELLGVWGEGPVNTVTFLDDNTVLFNAGTHLKVADMSDPSAPEITKSYLTNVSGIDHVHYHNGYFYATNSFERDRLYYYFHEDAEQPFREIAGTVSGKDLYISGDTGFSFSLREFYILNTSDPSDRIFWRTNVEMDIARPGTVFAYDVLDDHVLVTSRQYLHVIDISDPDNYVEQDKIFIEEGFASANIKVSADRLYTGLGDGDAGYFDISTLDTPQLVARVENPNDHVSKIQVAGDYFFVLAKSANHGEDDQLLIFDISDENDPILVHSIQPGVAIHSFDVRNNHIVLAAGQAGLLQYTLGSDHSITAHESVSGSGTLEHLLHHKNLAYVLTSDSTLYTVDVSDYSKPATLGHIDIKGLNDFVLHGSETLVITSKTGFQLIDVSDPSDPVITATYNQTPGSMNHVMATLKGDHLFLVCTDISKQTHIEVVDISDISNPVHFATYQDPSFSSNPLYPVVYGDHLFAVERGFGGEMEIYDISDYDNITYLNDRNIPSLRHQQLFQHYLAGIYDDKIYLYDLSEAPAITETIAFTADSPLNGLVFTEDRAVTGTFPFQKSTSMLFALDVSNPDDFTPTTMVSFDAFWPEILYLAENSEVMGGNEDMVITGTAGAPVFYIYSSVESSETIPSSLGQYESDLPVSVRLEANYPNPFNPTTNISFYLPEHSEVTITVYDLTGRQVALISSGSFERGSHHVAFDASDLASGIYLYRLQTPVERITRKMTLIK